MAETPSATPVSGARLPELARKLEAELGKAVVGQSGVVEPLLAAFFAGGHVLLEGVPGVAKTLLAKALARALELDFRRVQFTPDLMPADILGTNVWREDERKFVLARGPVFTEVLLADEVNRTPPKTQAALLEAMEERHVTIDGVRHELGPAFFVIATQNPLEHEGTYPLPEAQVDRFLVKILVPYPEEAAEREVLLRHHQGFEPHDLSRIQPVVRRAELPSLRREVQAVRVEPTVLDYVVRLVRATRQAPQLRAGASPRAGVALLGVAKALAALRGDGDLIPDDVKAAARPVLRHRLVLRPEAEIEGLSVEDVVGRLLDEVPVPR